MSQDNTRIADALIAVDQVHLLGLNDPLPALAHHAMAGPADEHARLIPPELADEKVEAQHARIVADGGKDFDVADHPHRAGRRRLGPGESRSQTVDPILEPPPVIEHHGNLAPWVAGTR